MMNKAKKERAEKLFELRKKSPGWAVFWSLIFTGAGHWYLGKIGKGFLFLFAQLFLWIFALGWIMWIATPISSYYDAKKHNEELMIDLGL